MFCFLLRTSRHLLQLFTKMLQHCFVSEAPEMLNRLRNFTWLSIGARMNRERLNFHFRGKWSFVLKSMLVNHQSGLYSSCWRYVYAGVGMRPVTPLGSAFMKSRSYRSSQAIYRPYSDFQRTWQHYRQTTKSLLSPAQNLFYSCREVVQMHLIPITEAHWDLL